MGRREALTGVNDQGSRAAATFWTPPDRMFRFAVG
jgi:hypothetical protein